jgi:hypothetical protein
MVCADCNVPLVQSLPEKKERPKDYIKFKEILHTYNLSDVDFLRSLFDAYNIRYSIEGSHFSQLRRLIQPIGIKVDEKQFEQAKELLKPFKARFSGLSLDYES